MPRLKAQLRRIARVKDCCARAVAGTAVKKLPIGAKKKRVQLCVAVGYPNVEPNHIRVQELIKSTYKLDRH